MALRDAMASSAAPYLRPTETVQAVFGAQTGDNLLLLGGWILFIIVNKYRIVAATNERILVLDSGKWSIKKARGVVTELPRATKLGPGTGLWHKIAVGDETLRVHRRFFKDVDAADAAAPVGS
jgi:hypothetical protein